MEREMNGKKAKKLRKLANYGAANDAVELQPLVAIRIFASPGGIGPSALFLGDRRLAPSCPRAIYQSLKRIN